MRSSKSSNGKTSRRLKARPTVVFPAPMKPTRNTVRKPPTPSRAGGWTAARKPGLVFIDPDLLKRFCTRPVRSFNAYGSTFLKVNLTTEGKQLNRRCGLAHRTCKGAPGPGDK